MDMKLLLFRQSSRVKTTFLPPANMTLSLIMRIARAEMGETRMVFYFADLRSAIFRQTAWT